jgi:hypothetical protein
LPLNRLEERPMIAYLTGSAERNRWLIRRFCR